MVDMISTEYEAKCSALSVVVNELDGGVKAHHGDECMQGKRLPPSNPYGTCGRNLATPDNVTGNNQLVNGCYPHW